MKNILLTSVLGIITIFCIVIGIVGLSKLRGRFYDTSYLSFSKIEYDQTTRTYAYYIPDNSDKLLVVLHGGGGNASRIARLDDFKTFAEETKTILLFPEALDNNWNDGRVGSDLKEIKDGVDDSGFIVNLINEFKLKNNLEISNTKITGASNGGMMTFRLICDYPNVFDKGYTVIANMPEGYVEKCNLSTTTGLTIIVGTEDPLMPYSGGAVGPMIGGVDRGNVISSEQTLDLWKVKNNCSDIKSIESIDNNKSDDIAVEVSKYQECEYPLQFIKVIGGGHIWYGGKDDSDSILLGRNTSEIDILDIIKAED